jgi:hypothetical protein
MIAGQSLVITGVVGKVRWAYYDAAQVERFTVTRSGQQWSLRGTVVLSDAFKLSQRPLMFIVDTKQGQMRWPILTCRVDEAKQLHATLGPPEP